MTYSRPANLQPPQSAQCAAAIRADVRRIAANSGRSLNTPSGGCHSKLFRKRSMTRLHLLGDSSTRIALNKTRVKNTAHGSESASCMTFPIPITGRIFRNQELSMSGHAQHSIILNFAGAA